MQTKYGEKEIASIILAAGLGSRMRSPHLHKVCYQLSGKPVIARSLDTYYSIGINSHFIVVGQAIDQVMQATSLAKGNHFFCHQTQQLGTGNATKCATQLMQAMNYKGDVIVVAGDKVIDESILTRLVDTFYKSNCDMAMIVGESKDFPSAGRIVQDENGRVLGIVETFDISKARLLCVLDQLSSEREIPTDEAKSLAIAYLKSESKAALALGSLWQTINAGNPITAGILHSSFSKSEFYITVNGKQYSPDEISNSKYTNVSVYLFKSELLYSALNKITSKNAQKEEYLTDVLEILANEGRNIQVVPVDYPEQVMAFNTPEEFANIQDYLTGRKNISVSKAPKTVRPANEWIRLFESTDGPGAKYLSDIYGDDHNTVESKRNQLISMLRSYVRHYDDEPVIITRAPGRVNLMGRHIDHQGGYSNLMAIDRDLYLVVGVREDRSVIVHNLKAQELPSRQIDTDEVIANYDGGDWLDFVDSDAIRNRALRAGGDWSQYVVAPVARFQAKYPQIQLKGMNIIAAGNIPMAAGLSSSSAVVVAVAEAIAHVNGIDLSPEQFVELCGEGEWFVGTRGGSADHAAIKFAQNSRVIQVGFYPFRLMDIMPFPEDARLLICNSHVKAQKTGGARDVFNHRVSCYHIGTELFKTRFPDLASKIEHLRDINFKKLGVSYIELLEMLKQLPYEMTRKEVRESIPEDLATRYLSSHSEKFDKYPVRSVVMYGLSECERSVQCAKLLRNERIEEFGRWMNISHNGDRVVIWSNNETSKAWKVDYSDKAMDDLIKSAKEGLKEAELVFQPGGYMCSTPEIDRMADIALATENVYGAQILGAGLGGCMAVLVKKDACEKLEHRMIENYYKPMNLHPEMFACKPVAGSSVVSF